MDFVAATEPLLHTIADSCADISANQRNCIEALEASFYSASHALGFPFARLSIITSQAYSEVGAKGATSAQWDNTFFSLNFDSFPSAWRTEYETKKYWKRDPLVRVVLEKMALGQVTFISTWLQASGGGEPSCTDIFRLAERHNLTSGLLLVHANGNRQCVVSLASPDSAAELEQRFAASSLRNYAITTMLLLNSAIDKLARCQRCVMRTRQAGQRDVTLTKTQKAVLLHYLQNPNATLHSIAEEQNISTETVKYHLKAIREKLHMHGASGHALAHHIKAKNII